MKKTKILFVVLLCFTLLIITGCIKKPVEQVAEEFCTKKETGEKMSLTEAREVANNSECTKDGPLKDTYMCNENTGTWWLDLDIKKEGCDPSCVINVVNKNASINWRCTGLITE